MSIVRAPRPVSNFYILDKRLSEDKRLSWAARGLLVFLLGKPDNWHVSIANLLNETAGSVRPSGRDAAYALLRELEQAGYVTRSRPHNVEGTFAAFDYIVRESPFTESQEVAPLTENPEMVLSPLTAEPRTAEPLPANPLQTSIEVYQGLKASNKDGGKPSRASGDALASKAHRPDFQSIADSFNQFWTLYPKKKNRGLAEKAWAKLNPNDALVTLILEAVAAAKCSDDWRKDGGQFVPYPSKWLNAQGWLDSVKPAEYSETDLAVISLYNEILAAADWPEAVPTIYSPERAATIREFLGFSTKPDWMRGYFGWLRDNLPAKPGCGFAWSIKHDTYLRAREGNFAALTPA